MKILQICFRPQIPANDGGAIAMYNITEGLSKNPDVELSIFYFNTPKHHVTESEVKDEFGLTEVYSSEINTSIKPLAAALSVFSTKSYNIERFNDDSTKTALESLLFHTAFDLIHFEGLYAAPMLETVRKIAPNAITVLRSHNIESLIWKRRAEQATGKLQTWYLTNLAEKLKNYEDNIIPKFDAIVPITDIDKPYFEEQGAKNIFTSSTGLLLKQYHIQDPMVGNAVFHLGSLDWLPNQEAVVWFLDHVWEKVIQKVPKAKFYLAGKNMPDWLKKYKSTSIKIIGEVESASDFMSSHGIMIVPLLSGSGMRIKIIEGMACGCPIVSTSIGAEGIICKDKEDIIIANEPQEFADSVINLLENIGLAENMSKKAHKNVELNYSNKAKTEELIAYYKSLIK